MQTPPGSAEPIVSAWRRFDTEEFIALLDPASSTRPTVIAIDGRSGAGKSTLASTLHTGIADSRVVSTDDVAWNYSMFDWVIELTEHIIEPVRAGQPVDHQPPGWAANGRTGSIVVPAGTGVLVIEGVGAGQHALADSIDWLIWVQSDHATAPPDQILASVVGEPE